jgi:hypothetical protein
MRAGPTTLGAALDAGDPAVRLITKGLKIIF